MSLELEESNRPIREWELESFSYDKRGRYYIVSQYPDGRWVCSCPHYVYRLEGTNRICKHIEEVQRDPEGYSTPTKNPEDYIITKKVVPLTFQISEFISLKYKRSKTVILVNGKEFQHCKYLLLNIDTNRISDYDHINSIDEAEELQNLVLEDDESSLNVSIDDTEDGYDRGHEGNEGRGNIIDPKTEFWGHCSNLQTWVEYGYDTRLLHRNLAFPLLKKLSESGDLEAKKVFKKEIAIRFEEGNDTVRKFLIVQGYLEVLTEGERETLLSSCGYGRNYLKLLVE